MSREELTKAVEEFQRGENRRANFNKIHQAVYDRLLRWLLGQGVPPEDCNDILQECLWKVWQRLDAVRDPERVLGWIWTILANERNRWLKGHITSGERFSLFDPQEMIDFIDSLIVRQNLESPKADAEHHQFLRERLTELLPSLTPRQAEVVSCRVLEGLSYEDTAAKMGTNVNNTRVLYFEARQTLKKVLANQDD